MTPAKNLILKRNIYVTGKRTFGELYVEGEDKPRCLTMEPEYDLTRATKTKSDTAIKAGRYKFIVQSSPKHGNSLRFYDVPGRFDVLMHSGNYDKETLGCIMPGLKIGHLATSREPVSIQDSKAALHKILAAITGTNDLVAQLGQTGWITIVDDAPKVAKSA